MGADPRRVDAEGQELYADPSYKYDAARIYMSQKTDVDRNFALAAGKVGSAKAKSAIGLKADGVRIIAREGIKLVTKTDKRNSQGGQVHSNSGIDLIAVNNDRTLQPLVLGDNLKRALGDIVNQVEKLNGIVNTFLMAQMEYNAFSQSHFHISPGFGAPTPPAISLLVGGITTAVKLLGQTQLSLVAQKANLAKYKIQYLNPASRSYINSRFNNVN